MTKSMSTEQIVRNNFDRILNAFPHAKKIWIACSGGMDSSVLLHLVYQNKNKIKQKINVVYVNHGLQENSIEWGKFCKIKSEKYGLDFRQLDIKENIPDGVSIEAWARELRYALIAELIEEDDFLFTGHHQDDQVETFFLQALRGGGPKGLASMPICKSFAGGIHARPLLEVNRSQLLSYANENNLNWREDASNADEKYDRNYLRKDILPEIEHRWPAYRETIQRLIRHQQDCALLLQEIGLEDLKLALNEDTASLQLDALKMLSIHRQKNLIFTWLKELQLASPTSRHIDHIFSDLINTENENMPCVNWKDVEIRRYRRMLYASKVISKDNVKNEYNWDITKPLRIMDEVLIAKSNVGLGLSKEKIKDSCIVIKYRQGGEKIRPHNKSHSISVKQLFQESGVLPWVRDRYPLIYIDNELALIPGLCVDKNYSANNQESSFQIEWSGYEKAIQ